MQKPRLSSKRIAIVKDEARLLTAIGITVFIVVFSLVASKSLFDQMLYQNKVISKKKDALTTAKANIAAADELTKSYQAFSEATTNVLGGNPQGDADNDGDNPKIILDALPSKYDFPALTTSLEKLLKDNGIKILSITGSDDEIAQAGDNGSVNPSPIEIPFTVTVSVNDSQAKKVTKLFERSIRPIQVQKISVTQNQGNLELTIDAISYYQPEKVINVREEVVR